MGLKWLIWLKANILRCEIILLYSSVSFFNDTFLKKALVCELLLPHGWHQILTVRYSLFFSIIFKKNFKCSILLECKVQIMI